MNTRAIAVRISLEGGKQVEGQLEIIGSKGQSALNRLDHGAGRVGVSTGQARQQMIGLGYQLNDLAVQIQGGANPLTALAQQGSQIVGMYAGQGGVKQAFSQFGQLVTGIFTKFPLMTAAVIATGVAIGGLTHEINEATGANVSMGDTVLAVFQTVGSYLSEVVKPLWEGMIDWIEPVWTQMVAGFKVTGNFIINGFKLISTTASLAFDSIPAAWEFAMESMKSITYWSLHDVLQTFQNLVNSIISGLNQLPGVNLTAPSFYDGFSLNEAGNNAAVAAGGAQGQLSGLWAGFGDTADGIMSDDPLGRFFDDIATRAAANAAARGKDGKGGGRSGGGKQNGKEPDPTGLDAMMKSLQDYATKAADIGKDIGDAIVKGFDAGADAVANFVKTGKFEIGDLVTDMLAQFARLATQHWITGPLAGLAGNIFKGIGGGFGSALQGALKSFDGGGWTGNGSRSGGLDGRGGFLAVMHPREEVYDTTRGQRGGGPMVMNVYTRDATSFAQSRTQVAANAARLLMAARRGM
jgi:phage-related minor tail protein